MQLTKIDCCRHQPEETSIIADSILLVSDNTVFYLTLCSALMHLGQYISMIHVEYGNHIHSETSFFKFWNS